MMHGWTKIQHPFDWMGAGAEIPGFLQMLAAISEFFGGMALFVGLLTPVAALGVICTMTVAAFGAMAGAPIMAAKAGEASKEPALSYLVVAWTLLLSGPGAFSIDATLFGSRETRPRNRTIGIPALRH